MVEETTKEVEDVVKLRYSDVVLLINEDEQGRTRFAVQALSQPMSRLLRISKQRKRFAQERNFTRHGCSLNCGGTSSRAKILH